MTDSEKIKELKEKIEYEYTEEYRNVKLFRPLIKQVEGLSKTFFSRLINKSSINYLNKQMQEYADIANYHQDRKIEYMNELRELEEASR